MHRAIGIRWMRHIGSTTPQVSMTYRWVSIVATLPLLHPSATIEGIWRGKQVTRKDRGTRRTIDTISWYRVKSRAAAIVVCFVACLLRGGWKSLIPFGEIKQRDEHDVTMGTRRENGGRKDWDLSVLWYEDKERELILYFIIV